MSDKVNSSPSTKLPLYPDASLPHSIHKQKEKLLKNHQRPKKTYSARPSRPQKFPKHSKSF